MEDDAIAEIQRLINEYRQRTSRIKELGYFIGSMWQAKDGRGYLQWWIRVAGKKYYVRKSDYQMTRARYHRGKHLRRIGQEYLVRINIALSKVIGK